MENKPISDICSEHLYQSSKDEILALIKNKKFVEAMSLMEALIKDHGNDEQISHLTAHVVFLVVLNDGQVSIDILNYLLKTTYKNFFDSYLGAYMVGIMLMKKTNIKEQTIKDFGERAFNMSPKLFKKIINKVKPKNNQLYTFFKEMLNGN